jgi:hypothetical protein
LGYTGEEERDADDGLASARLGDADRKSQRRNIEWHLRVNVQCC